MVRSGEDTITGTFDGCGPRSTLDAVLDEVAAAAGAGDLQQVPMPEEAIARHRAGADPEVSHVVLPTELVVRESAAKPPAAPPPAGT